MLAVSLMPFSLERMFMAVEKVRQRLLRATEALNRAQIPYAVIGGNAVAAWVSRVDEEAIRNTKDVDILLRRDDLERAKSALAGAGFVYHFSYGVHMFLDGPTGNPRSAVHVIFACEPVATGNVHLAPGVDESEHHETYRVVSLEALVRMKLTAYRRADQVHLADLISVGLIDASWLSRLPPDLAARLKEILDTPNG
jgi:hypothetical protein